MNAKQAGAAALIVLLGLGGASQPPAGLAVSEVGVAPFDEEGYRKARYRAVVDRDVLPARRIGLSRALRLHDEGGALFVDVLPAQSGYRDPVSGRWHLAAPHATIPGALWHPEAGRSPVDPALWQGLVDAIATARQDRPSLPVVLFCRADCWMGWNAARRLASGDLAAVFWLEEGIDGWHERGRALEVVTPASIAGT